MKTTPALQRILKIIAITSYLLIMLMGQIIALPFFFWLAFALFDFGNIEQLFAVFAAVGLITTFITINKIRTVKLLLLDILCFLLLASPLVWRMTAVPIELFNYWCFIIPTIIFALFYAASMISGYREYSKIKTTAS